MQYASPDVLPRRQRTLFGALACLMMIGGLLAGCGDVVDDPDASIGADAGANAPETNAPETNAPETGSPEGAPDGGGTEPEGTPDGGPDAGGVDGGEPESPPPDAGVPLGFVGSACESAADCNVDGAVCETDGYPGGMCTAACDRFCPDLDGFPTTFCVDSADLDGAAASNLGDGACHARCDFGVYPIGGCREGYGCVSVGRANEPETRRQVCLPGAVSEVSDCQLELAALGVGFEPTTIADRSPDGQPGLTCHVEDPVIVHPPIFGVDLVYYNGDPTPNITASCEMALALAQTADDVATVGVDRIRHIGTYNCRVIAGTSTLSRHAFGDAIDIFGFDLDDGRLFTLEDHWEHDTDTPSTEEALFLYDAAHRWFDARLWNIILTPNYNAAHDNHFHIDLTPDSNFLGSLEELFYIGENPTGD